MSRRERWRGAGPSGWWVHTGPFITAAVTAIATFAGAAQTLSDNPQWAQDPWVWVSAASAGALAFLGTKAAGSTLSRRHKVPADIGDLLRNRSVMIERVYISWIVSVFEVAVEIVGWINLSWKYRPDAVSHRRTEIPYSYPHGDKRAEEIPAGVPIDTVFDQSSQALLILGKPGSGKTMLLLHLTRALLERAKNNTDHPLPVVFHLSTWARRRPLLDDWLVSELAEAYEIPRRLGQAWVDNGWVMPLLDGLDTVAAEHREKCVEAINSFRDEHGTVPIVVSSRSDEYRALSIRLRMHVAVEIQALTPEDVSAILQRGSGSAATIGAALESDSTLWQLLDSPVWLSIIAQTTHEDLAAALPVTGTLQRRRELLSAYVAAMLQSRNGNTPYSRERTVHYLSWLASSLRQHRQSEFSLDRLELDWLASAPKRVVIAASALLVGTVAGLFFGQMFAQSQVAAPVAGVIGGGLALVFYVLGMRYPDLQVDSHLRWSWSAARIGLKPALLTAMIAGVAGALRLEGLRAGPSPLVTGVEFGLLCGVLVGLASGLSCRYTKPQVGARRLGLSPYMPLAAGLAAGGAVFGLLLLLQPEANFAQQLFFGLQVGLLVELTALIARALYVGGRESEWLSIKAGQLRPVHSAIVVGAVAALLYGLLAGLIYGFIGRELTVAATLFIGLLIGVTAGLFYALGQRSGITHPAELMRWSWHAFKSGLRPVLVFASIAGLLAGLTVGAMAIASGNGYIDVNAAVRDGFAVALIVALLGGLANGLSTGRLDRPSVSPNEGIRRCIQNALLVGLVVGVGVRFITPEASYGLVAGVVGALFFGGMAAVQHILVRSMLALSGATPGRFARFLDYAAERSILRKLGGRYIFAYQLLLEHFASPNLDHGLAVVTPE